MVEPLFNIYFSLPADSLVILAEINGLYALIDGESGAVEVVDGGQLTEFMEEFDCEYVGRI